MSRRPTRQLTLQFVLRTLKRLQMMTRLDHELLAKELLAYRVEVGGLGQYLEDVAYYMKKQGFDPSAHPNRNCAQCGGENGRDHNGARYCSTRCRQRAYRLRLKQRRQPLNRNKPRRHDTSFAAETNRNVTPTGSAP
jgi:hypothetical protein